MHWKKSLQGYGLNVKIVKAVCMLMYCVPGVKNTMIDIFLPRDSCILQQDTALSSSLST